jgi:CBS domain-containing protein
MLIREVMTPQVTTVRPDSSLVEIAKIMREEDIGSVPVTDDQQLLGMVTDRDIVVRALVEGHDGLDRTAADVMSPDVHCCTVEDDIDEVLRDMGDQQLRRLPVVDDGRRLVGIVALADLSREASPQDTGQSLKEISQPAGHRAA